MNVNLKPLAKQVIVITGATSGIGLTTARMAAKRQAKVVLVARNEKALKNLKDELEMHGGHSTYAVADVADYNSLKAAAEKAVAEFGGFDTWVNNAGGSIYGRIMDVPLDDMKRLFETNLWGVVNGSKIAVEHLRNKGGAIINLGSEVSDASVPLQGIYASSKHAVKGFTESLRMELEAEKAPISITLIKPTAIHTPFPENAKNFLDYEPQLPPPLYAPELVAETILYCTENPRHEMYVGGMAKVRSTMAAHIPDLYETINESMIDSMQNSGHEPQKARHDGLYEPNSKLNQRGPDDRFVIEHSLYQQAKFHPLLTGILLLGGGALAAKYVTDKRNGSKWMKSAKYLASALT
jgi:short-subunit dehydrogenase